MTRLNDATIGDVKEEVVVRRWMLQPAQAFCFKHGHPVGIYHDHINSDNFALAEEDAKNHLKEYHK